MRISEKQLFGMIATMQVSKTMLLTIHPALMSLMGNFLAKKTKKTEIHTVKCELGLLIKQLCV
jgi:hypothetical protein